MSTTTVSETYGWDYSVIPIQWVKYIHWELLEVYSQVPLNGACCFQIQETHRCAPVSADSVSVVSVICGSPQPPQKFENQRNKQFICFKMHAKQEQAITWWNPAAQTHAVLDQSSFTHALTLPHRTCLHSTSSILTVRIIFHVIAVFVFRKPLFIS
jgi:hypothetical protein